MKINLNNTEIDIAITEANDFEISFHNESTGLKKVVECEEIKIRPRSKHIQTKWISFDETPNGSRINQQEIGTVNTTGDDYNFFVEMFAFPIKKFAMNGLFRELMVRFAMKSFAIFDGQLELIENQPVPHPEPPPIDEDDIDISDAFES